MATELEDFLQKEAEENNKIERNDKLNYIRETNQIYIVINNFANVQSKDYRCYVIQQKELVILFLKENINIDIDGLKKIIRDDTVIHSYGINNIRIILDKNAFNAEIKVSNGKTNGVLKSVLFSEAEISLSHLQIPSELKQYPEYIKMIENISNIKELDMKTLSNIVKAVNANANSSQEDKISDKSLILNTIDVFESDMPNISIDFKDKLNAIKNYFTTHIDSHREHLVTLEFLLDSTTKPFTQAVLEIKNKEISIKFYLFLALSYLAGQFQRKIEQSKPLRGNRKRYIKYCNEILSGKRSFKKMDNLITYLKSQNPQFNQKHPIDDDKANLQELKFILDNTLKHHNHDLAKNMKVLFNPKAKRPRNRILKLMGFPTIGNDAEV